MQRDQLNGEQKGGEGDIEAMELYKELRGQEMIFIARIHFIPPLKLHSFLQG